MATLYIIFLMVVPWIEKYRPTLLSSVVLSPTNRLLLNRIVETGHFPNLMMHGPPGTGKTSAAINLIQAYRQAWGLGPFMSLNAGDDRGTDIIRGSLMDFAESGGHQGVHIVLMDEVDYMTEVAQSAMAALMQRYQNKVVFCFICNYLPRITERLQCECMHIRFGQLPPAEIESLIDRICRAEGLRISRSNRRRLLFQYGTDVRGMINALQQRITVPNWAKMYTKLVQDKDAIYRLSKGHDPKEWLISMIRWMIRTNYADVLSSPDWINWAWSAVDADVATLCSGLNLASQAAHRR